MLQPLHVSVQLAMLLLLSLTVSSALLHWGGQHVAARAGGV